MRETRETRARTGNTLLSRTLLVLGLAATAAVGHQAYARICIGADGDRAGIESGAPAGDCAKSACVKPGPSAAKPGSTTAMCSTRPSKEAAVPEALVDSIIAGILAAGSADAYLAGRSPDQILEDLGHDPATVDTASLQATVESRLAATAEGSACMTGSRCTRFGACSLEGDLSTATGPQLEFYFREKAREGSPLDPTPAPPFELSDLDGRIHRLRDYRGKHVALVFWAPHCRHAFSSLAQYQSLREDLAGEEFELLTLLVGVSDPADVRPSVEEAGADLPILLAPDKALAEAYGAHLVPNVMLVDPEGRIVRRWIGQKEPGFLARKVTEFTRAS